jgi:hypothetical protein
MRRWLQEFSFKKSSYERPNQKWICGRACQGQGCLAGPDARGNCGATAECLPLRKGDRWHCTRPPALGGACPDGPTPEGVCCRPIPKCAPVRNLRSLRGLTVLSVLALSLAALFILLGSDRGSRVLTPGDLSFAHASAMSKCSDCHAGVEGRPVNWLMAHAHSPSAHTDSVGCLKCHNVGRSPLQPHSLPIDQMEALTLVALKTAGKSSPPGRSLGALAAGESGAEGPLACATCHQEHRGQNNDLKHLSNAQCQACHAVQFASFSHGHPAFKTYPFERRTPIIFDHASHLSQHFNDPTVSKLAPHLCLDCHQTDMKGGFMLVKSFEQTCAACHGDQIKGKGAVNTGIPFISLPRFDDQSLAGPYAIGEWPEDADQGLSPFLRLLLSADPDLRAALDTLKGADLSSLSKKDPEKLKAAQSLAWGIKGLIYDIQTQGQDGLVDRIGKALGRPLSNRETEGVVSLLGSGVIKTAFAPYFPHLQAEVLAYRQTSQAAKTDLTPSPSLAAPGPGKVVTPDAWVGNGGWYAPDGSFTVFYRPTGHADRFLTTWLNLTVAADGAKTPAAAVFDALTGPKGVGLCVKCHSIDSQPVKLVNWQATELDSSDHKFNRFLHSAHLSLMDNRGCYTCHSLAESGSGATTYAAAFEGNQRDPSKFHSNFRPINKDTCAECHKPNFVREDCLLCHNYHIGHFKNIPTHTDLKTLADLVHPDGK